MISLPLDGRSQMPEMNEMKPNEDRIALRCVACDMIQEEIPSYQCCACGGDLEVIYDYDAVAKQWQGRLPVRGRQTIGLSRFTDLLPHVLGPEHSLGEGETPLVKSRVIGPSLGLPNLYFKCEYLNPTGSFKDRQITVALASALAYQQEGVIISSSGNAAAALATYAARAGLKALVFVPKDTPPPKLSQIAQHGARIVAIIDASVDAEHYLKRATIVKDLAQRYGWAPMITARTINSFAVEGGKTISFEVADQLGIIPDAIVLPVGGGGLLGGVYKGFNELIKVGVASHNPRMIGVQVAGCSTVAAAFQQNQRHVRGVIPQTQINGVGAPMPLDAQWALQSIRDSEGAAVEVTDEEVLHTVRSLSETEGLFVEPAGAVSVASLRRLVEIGHLKPDNTIVCCLTGIGFKHTASTHFYQYPQVTLEQLEQESIDLAIF